MNSRSHKDRILPRQALTLMELIAVLTILAGTAALVVPRMGSTRIETATGFKTEEQIATETTMHKIRDVIMGTSDRQGVWADLGQRPELFPGNTDYLLLDYASLIAVAPEYSGVEPFDPVTKIGWRGPYFVGHSQLTDAWGNELEIQIPDEHGDGVDEDDFRHIRLVSPGEDGILQTDPTLRIPAVTGDDILLFLRMAVLNG